jgi:pyruvate dehydrogenase E2 component (dihydrolipoamide acetyltransferase)
MAIKVLVPILGEAITEATLSSWLKKEGDPVQRGETIAELETAKATLALESPDNGILLKILVPEGTNLTIGQVVAIIGKPGEEFQHDTIPPALSPEKVSAPDETLATETQEIPRRISPAARRRAAELGISVEQIFSLSPDRRITTDDVERYAATRAHPAGTEGLSFQRIELTEMRRAIAQHMSSSQQIPQFSVSMEINADALLQAQNVLRTRVENVTVTVLLIYLVVQMLQKHPYLNAHFEENSILLYDTVYLSLAVATSRGLIAPVIPEAEKMTLSQIASYVNNLTQRTRSGALLSSDLHDGTFTISNLGMYGISQFVPLLNPPQVAIMGVGAIQQRWVALPGGGGRPAQMLNLTITADHRALDGEQVARFLTDLDQSISTLHPEQIPI